MLRAGAAALCLVGAVVAAGCGIEPGSGQCQATSLTAPPVGLASAEAPLTLTATLTSEGRPVAGASITFFSLTTPAAGSPGGPAGGSNLGKATTGADGVARLVRRGGTTGLLLPSERLVGYQADFTPLEKIDDVQYCKARVDAPLTGP